MLVDLSAMVGLDGVPLHLQLFPKLWTDIHNTPLIDRKFILMLISSHGFLEYVDAVLLDERSSLNNPRIFNFLLLFFPKVSDQVLTDQVQGIISQLVSNFIDISGSFNLERPNPVRHLSGDLRALFLVSSSRSDHLSPKLQDALKVLKSRVEVELSTLLKQQSKNNEESTSDDNAGETSTSSLKESVDNIVVEEEENDKLKTDKIPINELNLMKYAVDEKSKMADTLSALLKTLVLLIQLCIKTNDDKKEEKKEENPKSSTSSSSSSSSDNVG